MEAGDFLFAAANLVRAYGIAPEEALRAANAKFERRFKGMEALAKASSMEFAKLSLDEQEALWQEVKKGRKRGNNRLAFQFPSGVTAGRTAQIPWAQLHRHQTRGFFAPASSSAKTSPWA
jgi:hypothetical protein